MVIIFILSFFYKGMLLILNFFVSLFPMLDRIEFHSMLNQVLNLGIELTQSLFFLIHKECMRGLLSCPFLIDTSIYELGVALLCEGC